MMSEASVPDLTTGQKDRDAVKAQAVSEENGAEKSTADSATRLGDKTKASHAGAKRPKTLTDFFAARPSKRARKPTSPAQDQEDPCETGELSKATPMDALSSFSGRKALEEKPPGTGSSLGSDDGSNSEAKKKPKGGSGFVINESTPIDVSKLDPRQYERCKLEYDTMEPSWVRALQGEFKKPYFIQLKEFLASEVAQGRTIYPPERDIYSWSRYSPLKKIKVVILGQDPYHNQNQAHGLAFSVRQGVRTPPSLCNMYQELKSEYPDT
ncbi:uracil DNA glycosylase, partial [Spiromyces aspiralis]